jgi:hypothetical protein
MKRDWDTVRELLLSIEQTGPGEEVESETYGDRRAEISYHLVLLHEAGLIDAIVDPTLEDPIPAVSVLRLTWDGHEFLDAIRADTVWQRLKGSIARSGVALTFETVKALAIDFTKEQVKSHGL